ncbi:MAG: J domain-containing protein [Hyphomicrobiales bacterium]|nr:J domain-containing protein [Hyphomicrobiales bacterium]MCP5371715.1 J domain-containing protein [Hyphomicrobiales bacterium]
MPAHRHQRQAFDRPLGPAKDPQVRVCDWPGCDEPGEHRAPKSRQDLKDFHWFCMTHVRVYNKSWNYYEGMTDAEVEADVRRDTVWQRPTWRWGGNGIGGQPHNGHGGSRVRDDFGLFGDGWESTGGGGAPDSQGSTPTYEAMCVLDLKPPVDAERVKARYKELVKLHHPDANGGDKDAEERFKRISEAYRTVMESLSS